MIQEIRKMLGQGKMDGGIWNRIRTMKKSDWAVLALIGVLLLVMGIPTEKKSTDADPGMENISSDDVFLGGRRSEGRGTTPSGTAEKMSGSIDASGRGNTPQDSPSGAYVSYLEGKLKSVLGQMEGVGDVDVMVTVSDAGAYIVEKDVRAQTTVTSETDGAGGNRTISENSTEEQTIYVETDGASHPYIQQEKLPTIVGVVVVAEGGGNSVVISNISEAVQALLSVEAHRIKVVRMGSREEST